MAHTQEKNQPIENVPKEAWTLDLSEKNLNQLL